MKHTLLPALLFALTIGAAHADEFIMSVREANGGPVGQLTVRADIGESGSVELFGDRQVYATACEVVDGKSVSKQAESVTGMRFNARSTSADRAQIHFVWDELVKMTPITSGPCTVHVVKKNVIADIETSVAISRGARLVVLTDQDGRVYELSRR